MKRILLILFFVPFLLSAQDWKQLGQDINGEAFNDDSGHSVAISSDGNTVAIGAPQNDGNGSNSGHVRIYNYNGTSWVKLGQDIDGEDSTDFSGYSVSLSSDGSIVAIGAPYNIDSGGTSGHVRIYSYNGSSWVPLGQEIDGAPISQGGYSVSLSDDGNTVAIGAPLDGGVGLYSGHVRIYNYNGSSWIQLGLDIDAEAAMNQNGWSVSLSGDGNIVAIGAPYNSGNGSAAGHVRIFENVNGTWTPIGQDIDGEAADDFSGCSVSLSSDGNTVAIGAPSVNNSGLGNVRIYNYNGTSWIKLGQDIDGEVAGDSFGMSVSLSSDGSIVAIGAPYNNNAQNGYVRIYNYIGGSWVKLGNDIVGASAYDWSGFSVSLSSSGNTIAIGALKNNSPGYVSVYINPNMSGKVFLDIDSNTIIGPNEPGIPNQILEIKDSQSQLINYVTTNNVGNFFFEVDTGQYILSYYPPANWQETSNNTSYNLNIMTQDTIISDLNFGIAADITESDLTIDITTGAYVCDQLVPVWLTVKNIGTESITGFDVDLWIQNNSIILNISTGGVVSGNHVTWNYAGTLDPFASSGQEVVFWANIVTPSSPTLTLSSIFIDSARVSPTQPNLIELDSTNNFVQILNPFFCSFDPNDKILSPIKCYYEESDTLDYTIRFQNTGNFPANTVRIIDTLDLEKLNIMSFQVLGASHDYEWSIKPPAVLEVIYNHINLVDTSVSFSESQGFFKYRVIVRDSLPNIQPTANPAYIYFDFNSAIETNEVEVRFIAPSININLSQIGYDIIAAVSGGDSVYSYQWNTGDTSDEITPTSNGEYWVIVTDTNGCVGDTTFYQVTNIVSAISETINAERKLLRITNILGQETPFRRSTPLFYIYNDGTVEKKIIIE